MKGNKRKRRRKEVAQATHLLLQVLQAAALPHLQVHRAVRVKNLQVREVVDL